MDEFYVIDIGSGLKLGIRPQSWGCGTEGCDGEPAGSTKYCVTCHRELLGGGE